MEITENQDLIAPGTGTGRGSHLFKCGPPELLALSATQEHAVPQDPLHPQDLPGLQSHLRISHIGGANHSNLPWTLTLDEAIRSIELGHYSFIVVRDGRRTEVQVAQTGDGRKYLRCAADGTGTGTDTLSALPDCP